MTKPTAEEIKAALEYTRTHGRALPDSKIRDGTRHLRTLTAAYRREKAVREEAIAALQQAQRFITNGVEFGYIRLFRQPDPALETLPTIEAVLAKAIEPQKQPGSGR